jgi:hypothetical protein
MQPKPLAANQPTKREKKKKKKKKPAHPFPRAHQALDTLEATQSGS